MKESIKHRVAFCKVCNKPYIPDVDGDNDTCDSCADLEGEFIEDTGLDIEPKDEN